MLSAKAETPTGGRGGRRAEGGQPGGWVGNRRAGVPTGACDVE